MKRDINRIIDANFNRAREALRVMEDYARFVLNDPAGCEALKSYRHHFADTMKGLSLDSLLLSRDIWADVGTTITVASEQQRRDPRDVCVAATKRLPEALPCEPGPDRRMHRYVSLVIVEHEVVPGHLAVHQHDTRHDQQDDPDIRTEALERLFHGMRPATGGSGHRRPPRRLLPSGAPGPT